MKRLYIVVEGQTEEEFVKTLVAPYFQHLGFYDVRPILIRTSRTGRGGFISYQHLRNDITLLLKQERDIVVSTFVDFFRIPTNVPEYENCHRQKANIYDKVSCLERAIGNDINDRRFIPYIQLHEFEALLFSSNKGFSAYYSLDICESTQAIIDQYENPELINDSPETAPSKRLRAIIPNYEKVIDGNLIAIEIGITSMIKRCWRFGKWLDFLTEKLQE